MILALVAAMTARAVAAGLTFRFIEETDEGMLRSAGAAARRHLQTTATRYGLLVMDGRSLCMEKVPNPRDPSGVFKVKVRTCDYYGAEPAQLWQYERIGSSKYNLLRNRDGGCMAVRGEARIGKTIRVMECDNAKPSQQWEFMDTLISRAKHLCVGTEWALSPKINDPVILVDCDAGYYSLDLFYPGP